MARPKKTEDPEKKVRKTRTKTAESKTEKVESVQIQEEAAPAPKKETKKVSKTDNKYTVTSHKGLNVRKGPGMEFEPPIKVLSFDTEVIVYEQKNGFGRIGNGQWVSMNFLK